MQFKIVKILSLTIAVAVISGCGGDDRPSPSAVNILFVGNSYTFARIAPALQYNSANINDLTSAFNVTDPTGGNSYPVGSGVPPAPCAIPDVGCFEPHPWGGVPGIFKAMTVQMGLNYSVSMSARNAATLRGHFLNTANANWDLRSNLAKYKWDAVVLQGQSDEPLSPLKAKNGNPVSFSTYANLIEQYIHKGAEITTTEADIFGGLANCTAAVTASVPGPGLSSANCTTSRVIPANANANPNAKVFLMQTWARPDMVEAHKCTIADKTTLNGAPVVDPTCSNGANGSTVTALNNLYYTGKPTTLSNLNDMTADMANVFNGLVNKNPNFAGVIPVGNAFQSALNESTVKSTGFYKPDGTYDETSPLLNLWWLDRTHASVYGSYLTALVTFGRITGINPTVLGSDERAAKDLGISSADATMLQRVASQNLLTAGVALR